MVRRRKKKERKAKGDGIPYQRLHLRVERLRLGLASQGGPPAHFPRHEAAIAACLISGNFIKLLARLTGQEDAHPSEIGVGEAAD